MDGMNQLTLKYDTEKRLFILEEAFFYQFPWTDSKHVEVPKGTKTNFASIPQIARWLVSPIDEHIVVAALIHDYLVNEFVVGDPKVNWVDARGYKKEYSPDWNEAIYIMKRIMEAEGQPTWKRMAVWAAVRIYGIVQRKK